jgi:hypothetical protein
MVSPEEWGPGAWELLHGLAEKVGNQTNLLVINDERNELKLTLRHLWALLPCKTCQKHYREWVQAHSPDSFIAGSYIDLKESMRSWLFALHENVNRSRGVESGITLEALQLRYATVSLREKASALKAFYQRGLLARTIKPEDWKPAWRHLDALLRLVS